MNRLYLIRHGATAGNLERRYVGRTDEPLCPQGYAQLEELRKRALQVDRLFVSPMLRARQTAAFIFPGVEQIVVDGFRETDFGRFEGKTGQELWSDPVYRDWVNGGCRGNIPDGEPPEVFRARCIAAFSAAVDELPEGARAGFVVHGGVIMAVLERFALTRRGFYDWHMDNGGCAVCRYERGTIQVESGEDR